MLAGFLFGLVVVASLAGTVGAFFVAERRERAGRDQGVAASGEPLTPEAGADDRCADRY
jgi:hypothetical protein